MLNLHFVVSTSIEVLFYSIYRDYFTILVFFFYWKCSVIFALRQIRYLLPIELNDSITIAQKDYMSWMYFSWLN